jgi:hypothetical protein
MKQINIVRIGEPFLLLCDLKNETPYSLKFKNSQLELNSSVKFKTAQQDTVTSFLSNGWKIYLI